MTKIYILLILLFVGFQDNPDPLRFQSEINDLTKADHIHQIGPGGIMFLGSSSIRMWKSLEEDFKDAWAVVGYNSNSLVESTLEGIPTFPLSEESVVWDVSNKNKLENIEKPFIDIDRTQWCYDAGYMLWSLEEINNGIAWEHLKGVYFK